MICTSFGYEFMETRNLINTGRRPLCDYHLIKFRTFMIESSAGFCYISCGFWGNRRSDRRKWSGKVDDNKDCCQVPAAC